MLPILETQIKSEDNENNIIVRNEPGHTDILNIGATDIGKLNNFQQIDNNLENINKDTNLTSNFVNQLTTNQALYQIVVNVVHTMEELNNNIYNFCNIISNQTI